MTEADSARCGGLKGKTPEATISAMLAAGTKPGGLFARVDKGTDTLAETASCRSSQQVISRSAHPLGAWAMDLVAVADRYQQSVERRADIGDKAKAFAMTTATKTEVHRWRAVAVLAVSLRHARTLPAGEQFDPWSLGSCTLR